MENLTNGLNVSFIQISLILLFILQWHDSNWIKSGFNVSFWSFVMKIFVTEFLGELWKFVAQQTVPAHKTIYFSQSLKGNSLSETIVSQAQLEFTCSNSAIVTVGKSVKYV